MRRSVGDMPVYDQLTDTLRDIGDSTRYCHAALGLLLLAAAAAAAAAAVQSDDVTNKLWESAVRHNDSRPASSSSS